MGVVAHGAWSARRNLPKQATPRMTPGSQSLQSPGLESHLQSQEPHGRAERHEPTFDADSGLASLTQFTKPEKKPDLDILIDAIAPVTLESPVSGEAALAAMPSTRRVGSKPFAVEASIDEGGDWESPRPGQRYRAFISKI